MAEIRLRQVSLSFGPQVILENVDFLLNDQQRLALVGANGVGKSVLLKLMAGFLTPDHGKVTVRSNTPPVWLPQQEEKTSGTVWQETEKVFATGAALLQKLQAVGESLEKDLPTEILTGLIEQQASLLEELEESGYEQRRSRIEPVLFDLGFNCSDFDKKVASFSAGRQRRLALACALFAPSKLLLLDEPTNYLDMEARQWLRHYLNHRNGGFLLVSHDRDFIDQVVGGVVELSQGHLRRYQGAYTDYRRQRRELLARQSRQARARQQEIEGLRNFVDRFRAKSSKASQAQSRLKSIEKIAAPQEVYLSDNRRPKWSLPAAIPTGKLLLTLRKIGKGFPPAAPLFVDVDLEVNRGDRLWVAGGNGVGKSTLLAVMAGAVDQVQGSVKRNQNLVQGYFTQSVSGLASKTGVTVIDFLEKHAPSLSQSRLRRLLGAFLFSGDAVHKKITVLSGGEQSRLRLLTILLRPANLLILDEPDSHLDVSAKEVLIEMLKEHKGALIFVSHDQFFVRELATKVLLLTPEGHSLFAGDYLYYRQKSQNDQSWTSAKNQTAKPEASNPNQNAWANQKKEKNRTRQLLKDEKKLLDKIETEEAFLLQLNNQLSRKQNYTDLQKARGLQSQIDERQKNIENLHQEWQVLTAQIQRL